MITPLRPLLDVAREHKFAYGAFNVNSPLHAKAAIEMHEYFRSGCILQGSEGANGFMGGSLDFREATVEEKRIGAERIAEAVRRCAENSKMAVVLHLDHGKNFESVKAAIDGGYTSVMIDGSSLPLEQNIELTKKVVDYAHLRGVSVEGELGILKGVEDHVGSITEIYTNPTDALTFIRETGVDALTFSYGTQHGKNKGKNVQVRKEIPMAIYELLQFNGIECALVSHGSSSVPKDVIEATEKLGAKFGETGGVPVEQLQEVIPYWVAKINVDTDIRFVITRNTWEYFAKNPNAKEDDLLGKIWDLLQKNPEEFDPRKYMVPAQQFMISGKAPNKYFADLMHLVEQGVKEIVGERIVHFGSVRSMDKINPKTLEEMAEFYK